MYKGADHTARSHLRRGEANHPAQAQPSDRVQARQLRHPPTDAEPQGKLSHSWDLHRIYFQISV